MVHAQQEEDPHLKRTTRLLKTNIWELLPGLALLFHDFWSQNPIKDTIGLERIQRKEKSREWGFMENNYLGLKKSSLGKT